MKMNKINVIYVLLYVGRMLEDKQQKRFSNHLDVDTTKKRVVGRPHET